MPSDSGSRPATQADIQGVYIRIDALGAGVHGLDSRGDNLDVRFDKLDSRVDKLDRKVDRVAMEVVNIRGEMATKADLTGIQKQLNHIVAVLDSVSGNIVDHSRTIVVWDKILASHEKRLGALEARA